MTAKKSPSIVADRLAKFGELTLLVGAHSSFESGVCAMEAVAWLAGEKHSDHPKCTCPVVGAFVRRWNDRLATDADRNRLIKPLIPTLIGTRGSAALEQRRGWMAADWAVRVQTPLFLRASGGEELAARLEALPELTKGNVRAARLALDEIYARTRDERNRRFRELAEKNPEWWKEPAAAAAFSAAAAAAAFSAAFYAAAAAAAAFSAAFYAADAAADAADAFYAAAAAAASSAAFYAADAAAAFYAADAAADAADAFYAADAAADATFDRYSAKWWEVYSAFKNKVYAAWRAAFRERFADVASKADESAVELVKRMCALRDDDEAAA